jgi:hypothetical protein
MMLEADQLALDLPADGDALTDAAEATLDQSIDHELESRMAQDALVGVLSAA